MARLPSKPSGSALASQEDAFRGEEEIVLTALQRKPEAGRRWESFQKPGIRVWSLVSAPRMWA